MCAHSGTVELLFIISVSKDNSYNMKNQVSVEMQPFQQHPNQTSASVDLEAHHDCF